MASQIAEKSITCGNFEAPPLIMTLTALGADANHVQKLLLFMLPSLLPNVRVDNRVKSQWLARYKRVEKNMTKINWYTEKYPPVWLFGYLELLKK
jgi:hypothetical protein